MKNLTKFLTVFLLALLGANLQPAWALTEGDWFETKNNAKVYFDNSKTQWSNVSLMLGRQWNYDGNSNPIGSYGTNMSAISNTKLYYVQCPNEAHMTTMAFFGVKDWGWSGGDDNIVSKRANYTNNKYTDSYNTGLDGGYHLYTPANGNANASLTKTDYNSRNDMNGKNQTLKVTVDGATPSTLPAILKLKGTYLSEDNASTRGEISLNSVSGSYNCVVTGLVTMSYSNLVTGYQFDGWYNGSTKVGSGTSYEYNNTGETTITAKFSEITYNITATANPAAGGTVTPTTATAMGQISGGNITATNNPGYHFVNWEVGTATGTFGSSTTASTTFKPTKAGTVVANFAANEYAITYNGEHISSYTDKVEKGTYNTTITVKPVAAQDYAVDGITVTKTDDASAVSSDDEAPYTFEQPAFPVTVTVRTHSTAVTTYTIRFLNYDGTVLQSGQVEEGHTPVYSGATPTKPSDAEWDYTFNGWTPTIAAATQDQDYTATYSSTRRKYTLTWDYAGGSVVTEGTPAGQVANADPITAPELNKTGYTFTGWDPTVPATMPAADATYTAQWQENLSSVTTAVNAVGTTAGQTAPTKSVNAIGVTTTSNITASTAKTGYKFVGWTLDNCTRTDGGAADAITITIKGLGNTNAATVTANYVQFVHSGWYMMGTNFGEWDNPTTYEIGYPYRGMANVYYFPTDVSSYFKVHDKSKRYSIDASTTDDITPELGKIYNLVQNETKSMTLSASNVWVIVKTSDTKKFMVQDGSLTYYTVSVSEPTDHSTALTLKDKAWDLETNQYSTNDTYVLSVTAATGYRAVLKVNDVATNWTKTSGSTYTYEAQTSDNTTLTVEYVQQYAVTHGYYTGCSSTMGTYTVTDNETAISSGTKVDAGTVVTFAAEANTGYQFDGWYTSTSATGDPESTETTYNKTINATTSLYAKFSKKRWTVTVAKAGTGDGTLIPDAGSYSVTQVDGQSFTATPAKGSWFEGWTITTGTGSWTETKFYPTSDATITATFTAYVRSLAVTNVNVGKMATVTFTKDGHYSNPAITYELWKGDQSTKVTDGTTFTPTQTGATFVAQVAGTYTVKAIVKQNETTVDEVFSNAFTIGAVYTVNFAVSPLEKGCTVTPATPKENVEIDTPFAISATAGTGYHFNKWVAEPENTFTFEDATSASTQVTMTAAAVTSTITATFSPNTYSVRFNANSPSGQKATGTMEDQSFEYDEAAKALTENAFVRLGYNFLGWSADASATEATYTDKQAVQNLATESGAVVNLYAVWQLKNDCSITVTQPDASDGTITPSEKVTNANVEGTVYTYTFTPASDAVTFMNWTITNAICVDGTNERSNPVKIKTYGEATIRANVKENLVSVTLKVLPNDQWGYFKVNGNNVASGTVINVGSKTDAKVFAYTNFGYAFTDPKFEWSEDITDLIDFNEENGVMKGKGKVGKVTLIANFKVDTYTNWKLFGDWDWNNGIEFRKHADQNTKKIAYATVHLTLKGSAYQFQLDKSGTRYYNEGTMNDNGYRFGWIFKQTNAIGQNCKFGPPQEGDYVFRLDYNNEDKPTLTVLMPDDQHYFPEGTTIYFNNHNENSWGRSIIRFGCDGGMAEAYDMTLVPGTANLYSYTFPDGYKYFQVYQIANNYGWTGAKDKSGSTTYGIRNIGEGDYKIGRATDDLTDGAAAGYVIRIQTNHSKGNYDVEYYRRDVWNTLESSRYSVTYTKNDFTGGSLKVEQWENNDGSARTTLEAGTTKVDQSRWITITATPEIGYKFVKMSVTTSGGTADHYETTWKYAVHEDITAITAEFEQVNKYTFYVKNTTDANWHKNGETAETRDVYIYYDNAKGGDQKVSYWGWPGLMATPMDKNHEWYKVEMTNAYFTIGNWILNNGVGPDCPQTIPYAADNGVPKFNSQEMEGKYYEIVQKGDEFNTYELQAASATPSFYRVITNDGKYTSNVATVDEKVSFFATTAGAKLQKSGESGWTDVDGGTISISESNVYVATITEGDAISTPEVYKGNYYIRTDGADGRWGDYKDPSKNNAMTYFTPRPGETYSYYWIQNLGKGEGSFNVKAKVANDYNDNLAGEIANDANTNIYGNINQTANGSNVRFSYEPTTNAFERAILSGSADDSYLNIVGANIYSDVSCKAEFALDMDTYKTNPKACKLRDISDWVYEMTIYAKVPDTETAIGVDMYSLYNGNRSTLLDDKVIMAKGTGAATYKLRVTYDFKKNRITTSWSPSSQTITETMTVNADIQFLQVEKGDVSQITLSKETNPNVKSLEYLLYVLEIEDPGAGNRGEEHYRISLPFDCRVSDIYGIEGYVELDDAGRPISGDWGIQEYDGKTRAKQGWYDNSPIQNFWRWLRKDEVMHAGQGYSISVDKAVLKWSTIGEEVTRTICDANGTNCQDVTTTEDRAAHRLYFPSTKPGFDLANSTTEPTTYEPITCTKTPGNRDIYDSDWRFMGSTAYNNIKTDEVKNGRAGDEAVPEYLYVLNAQETEYVPVSTTDAAGFIFRSFGAYMFQFHGTIAWNIYTQSHPESSVSAPRYSANAHAPLKMHVDVMEGEEMVAQAFVELNDKATTGFDQKKDLTLMKSSKVARAYTTTEGIDYAANCLPFESTIVPMTVNTLHAGDYTLHLEGADNVAVYLIDYQHQTETLISAGNVEVELGKGSSSDRFALRFDVAAAPTDIKNANGETMMNDGQKTQKLLINGDIYLINAGRVYNVLGVEE